MAGGTLSREAWVDAALAALAEGGIEAARVEVLARGLGVTKGSFYWHFRGRDALHDAMLERWEQTATQAIIDEVEAGGGDAHAMLEALFVIAVRRVPMALEAALRQWAKRAPKVRRAVARIDERRMRYLRAFFEKLGVPPEDAQARSFLAYAALFGDHFIAARDSSLHEGDLRERCARLLFLPRQPRRKRRPGVRR